METFRTSPTVPHISEDIEDMQNNESSFGYQAFRPDYVINTKWMLEGLLLPIVGIVGIVGNDTLNLVCLKDYTIQELSNVMILVCR